MKYQQTQIAKQAFTLLKAFLTLRPVPQPPAWVHSARQLMNAGYCYEAAALLDLMAKSYGRESARKAWLELSAIPFPQRGLGFNAEKYLRDQSLPCLYFGDLFVKSNNGLYRQNVIEGQKEHNPLEALVQGLRLPELYFVTATEHGLLVLAERKVYLSPSLNEPFRQIAELPNSIRAISACLDDGSFLVSTAAPNDLLAADCYRLRLHQRGLEIQSLPNTQQSLMADCVAWKTSFVLCGGGIQSHEVRFLDARGNWTTRFAHQAPVKRIARSEYGPVSIDSQGLCLLWDNQELKVLDDCQLAFHLLETELIDKLEYFDASFHWNDKKLYLSRPKKVQTLSQTIQNENYLIEQNSYQNQSFLQQLFPYSNGLCLALLADGALHFWDLHRQQVSVFWQMPVSCASPEELQKVMNSSKLSLEEDPRLRLIDFSSL